MWFIASLAKKNPTGAASNPSSLTFVIAFLSQVARLIHICHNIFLLRFILSQQLSHPACPSRLGSEENRFQKENGQLGNVVVVLLWLERTDRKREDRGSPGRFPVAICALRETVSRLLFFFYRWQHLLTTIVIVGSFRVPSEPGNLKCNRKLTGNSIGEPGKIN